jgi:response regulator RpfG family c-di-GMP phosphodiesterase
LLGDELAGILAERGQELWMIRILVVEDEPSIAFGLRSDLTLEGYEVEIAEDGETASRRATEEPLISSCSTSCFRRRTA